jgi:hypothetical protein
VALVKKEAENKGEREQRAEPLFLRVADRKR